MSTKIEWTDESWNPVRGCTRVSKGCENCYAETQAHRFSGPGQAYEGLTVLKADGPRWTGKIRLVPEALEKPLRWRKPRRVFVNSMSDLFHEGVPIEFIDQVFAVMALAPQHTFQILTKRPKRMRAYLADKFTHARVEAAAVKLWRDRTGKEVGVGETLAWPLANVWLGVSVEDQATADERLPVLLEVPTKVRFVSYEPALGEVELDRWLKIHKHWKGEDSLDGPPWAPPYPKFEWKPQVLVLAGWKCPIDWVICGGESGAGARPMHPDWARQVRDQCSAAGVPFFHKQNGEWVPAAWGAQWINDSLESHVWFDDAHLAKIGTPDVVSLRVGKKAAGRLLDGREHNEFPTVESRELKV